MVVCFYADLYWILNFIMNLFLLYITAWWLHEPAHIRRWVFSSAFCAIVSVIITYISNCVVRLHAGISAVTGIALLVLCAYRPHNLKIFVKISAAFIFFSAFTAGMLFMIRQVLAGGGLIPGYTENARFSLLFLILSVFIFFILFRFLRVSVTGQDLRHRSVVNAILVHNGKRQEIKALYDTGNHLVSPYTGEPVAVVSNELSDRLGLGSNKSPLLIPYNSIGGSGILKAYRIDVLQLQDGSVRKNFLAAVSDNICTDKEIQMILNNQLIEEGGHDA